MMEHIRQFDWCTTNHDPYFVREEDIDKCVTERIIKNKFVDPLTAYDSEDDNTKVNIDWSEVFVTKEGNDKQFRTFVPCLRQLPAYPKLSSLTGKEHYMCLKVLCSQNPHILPGFFIPRPTKTDLRVFQELKNKYEAEQKEYLEWARTMWSNGDCIRALRPKPTIEMVYEAEYKMRWHTVQSFPKEYTMAAQIPLTKEGAFDFVCKKNLIDVNISELPQVDYPVDITRKYSILRPCSTPEPCEKHPCRFILPNEISVSILPTTEVQRELAQYAAEQGAEHVASEAALKCLLETDRSWILPVSICQGLRPDGEKVKITVIGNEFTVQKEPAPRRTYKALKHMLHSLFIPHTEKSKLINAIKTSMDINKNDNLNDDSDDDEEDNRLIIDEREPVARLESSMTRITLRSNTTKTKVIDATITSTDKDKNTTNDDEDNRLIIDEREPVARLGSSMTRMTLRSHTEKAKLINAIKTSTDINKNDNLNDDRLIIDEREPVATLRSSMTRMTLRSHTEKAKLLNAIKTSMDMNKNDNFNDDSDDDEDNRLIIDEREPVARLRSSMTRMTLRSHTEKAKLIDAIRTSTDSDKNTTNRNDNLNDDSDDEDDRLLIDLQGDLINNKCDNETENSKGINDKQRDNNKDDFSKSPIRKKARLNEDCNDIGIFTCMCKDTIFERPPPRSFKLWEVKDKNSEDKHKIIVHCSHKTREELHEVILEPIPEYLIDISGTEHSQQKRMSLALSLLLRNNATLLNARIDGVTGDLACVERMYLEDISTPNILGTISATIHSVLDQFSGLLPGHYLLVHEPSHGTNGLLYSTSARAGCGPGGDRLSLSDAARESPVARDEASEVKVAPNFAPVLLPYHKYRKILPCAFTPYEQQLPKEPKKPVTRQKTPPQAIRWPKRKNKRCKKRRI